MAQGQGREKLIRKRAARVKGMEVAKEARKMQVKGKIQWVRWVLAVWLAAAGIAASDPISKTVKVPAEKYTAFDIPSPGKDLILFVEPEDPLRMEMDNSDFKYPPENDTFIWKKGPELVSRHEYHTTVVPMLPGKQSSREYVGIKGEVRPKVAPGSAGGPPLVKTPFEVDVPSVDIDIGEGADQGPTVLGEDVEETPGGAVGLGPAAMQKITIRRVKKEASFQNAKVKLWIIQTGNGGQVKVWKNATPQPQDEIASGHEFFPGQDPNGTIFWVEGKQVSASVGDVKVKVTYTTPGPVLEATSDSVALTVLKVDINGDYNRDGNPADHANEADAVTFAGPKGMVILANTDDDVADQTKQPDCADGVINGANDLADIYTLKLAKLGIAAGDIPSGMTLELSVENPSGEPSGAPAAKDRVRIFRSKAQDAQGVVGPDTLPDKVVFKKNPGSSDMDIDLLGGTGDLEMGIEGIEYGREVIVKLVLKLNGQELGNDTVRLMVSAFLALSNIDKTTKVYVAAENDPAGWPDFYNAVSTALNGVVPIESYGLHTFIQDFAEIGCSRSAPGQAVRKLCVMMGLQGGWFEDRIDADNGYFATSYGNIGGNIEASPPIQNYDYGRLVVGSTLPGNAEDFFKVQKLQTDNGSLIKLQVGWLAVGHVDEVFTIVPAGSGFKVLVADLQLAIDILRNNPGEETSGGFEPRADILAGYDDPGNALMLALINNKLAAIRSALSSGLGINQTDFIKVPVPFTLDGGIFDPNAGTYLPNMVNMLVVKNAGGQRKLAIPKPYFDPLKTDVSTKLTGIGYQAAEIEWIDTREPHAGSGEAHCATNPRREAP